MKISWQLRSKVTVTLTSVSAHIVHFLYNIWSMGGWPAAWDHRGCTPHPRFDSGHGLLLHVISFSLPMIPASLCTSVCQIKCQKICFFLKIVVKKYIRKNECIQRTVYCSMEMVNIFLLPCRDIVYLEKYQHLQIKIKNLNKTSIRI